MSSGVNKRNAITKQAKASGVEITRWNRASDNVSASVERYTLSISTRYLMGKCRTRLEIRRHQHAKENA